MYEVKDDCDIIMDRYRMSNYMSCIIMEGHWLMYKQHHYRGRMIYMRPKISQSSERSGNRCPDTRFSLMRIRNILIKTHNPPLNPSLQNHLHSLVPLHPAAATAHSGPLFCLGSSLTEGYVCLCLPSVSVIFDPLSLDFQTR